MRGRGAVQAEAKGLYYAALGASQRGRTGAKAERSPQKRLSKHTLFCTMIARVERAFMVYENAHALVFLDTHPIHVGHVLVVPHAHVEAFYALEEGAFLELMRVVRRVAAVIGAAYQPRKVGMLAAGFEVAHAHIHILPLYDAHDLTSTMLLAGRRAQPAEHELRLTAEHLQEGLRAQSGAAL